jgi:hypothetical protein
MEELDGCSLSVGELDDDVDVSFLFHTFLDYGVSSCGSLFLGFSSSSFGIASSWAASFFLMACFFWR